MSAPSGKSVPRLRPGCRLSEISGQEAMLMVPEGALELAGPAPVIVGLCDGVRTFDGIVDELLSRYAGVEREQIAGDTAELLVTLKDKRVLDY